MSTRFLSFRWPQSQTPGEYFDNGSHDSLEALNNNDEGVPSSAARRAYIGRHTTLTAISILVAGLIWAFFFGSKPAGESGTYVGSVPHLRGKKVVMIGDSIMRYKYINLVYYMHRGVRISSVTNSTEPGTRNPVDQQTWNSWTEFYSAPYMDGTEECDCFRPASNDPKEVLENRHYSDDHYDVTFYHFEYDAGMCSFRGRDLPLVSNSDGRPDWCFNLSGFMTYLMTTVKPDVVMMNQGLQQQISGQSALHVKHFAPLFDKFIWFTTTQSADKRISKNLDRAVTDMLTSPSTVVVNAWQISMNFQERWGPDMMYWDKFNFLPWVYDEMLRVALNHCRS